MANRQDIILIGCGGIGSILADLLVRSLQSIDKEFQFYICDGDSIEYRNLERQTFTTKQVGENKAISKVRFLEQILYKENIFLIPIVDYIDEEKIDSLLTDNCIVILAVDNYKTRKIVQEKSFNFNNITIVSAANFYDDGDVSVYIRRDGEELTPPIWEKHKEILEAVDFIPSEVGCEEVAKTTPQLINANNFGATLAFNIVFNILEERIPNYKEIYFDVKQNIIRQVNLSKKFQNRVNKLEVVD